jgi:hypothetical protein
MTSLVPLDIDSVFRAVILVLLFLVRPEKLMEHLKLFGNRLNIPRLIRVCDEQQHWKVRGPWNAGTLVARPGLHHTSAWEQ